MIAGGNRAAGDHLGMDSAIGGVKASRSVFDGIAAVGRKRLADGQGDPWRRFRGQAFDGITIEAGVGTGGGHPFFKGFPALAPSRTNL
jgi:hypothetical protein